MADEPVQAGSADNSAKNIIKNLGNLNKEIIKALANAQKVDSKDSPKDLDIKAINARLGAFATLIGDKGALRTIVTSLNNFDISTKGVEITSAIVSSKSIVSNIGKLVDAIGPVATKIDAQTLSLDDIRDKITNTLDEVRTTLTDFEGGKEGLLSYFYIEGDKSAASKRVTEINKSVGSIKGLINGLVNGYGKLSDLNIDDAKIEAVSASITGITTKDTGTIAKIIKSLADVRDSLTGNKYLTDDFFKFFLDDKKAAEGEEGPTYVKTLISGIEVDDNGNEKIQTIEQQYLKNSSTFGSTITRIKTALTTLKQVKNIVDNYAKLFGKTAQETAVAIGTYSADVKSIYQKWGLVFGKDSITDNIINSLNEASKFNPDIPANFIAPEENGSTPFADKSTKINSAVKEISKIKPIIDSFIGSFAVKPVWNKEKTELISAGISSIDNIANLKKQVSDMKDSLDRDVFGDAGSLAIILGMLESIGSTSASWKMDGDLFLQKGAESTVFGDRVTAVKDAVKAIGKVQDIFKEVVKTEKKITDAIDGTEDSKSFYDAYDGLDAIINADDNPIAFSLSLCYDVDAMINKLLNNPKFVALQKRAQNDEKSNPWAEQITQTTGILKAIGSLTKIPNQVQKTSESFDKMESVKNIERLIENIKSQTKQVLDDIGDGLNDVNDIVMSSGINKIDKETAESLNTTNTVLGSISDLVNTIVTAGERMEEFGYRRLVHASIQIEFFIEILSTTLDELADTSKELIANAPTNLATAKKIKAALDPIADTYTTLHELFGIIDETKLMPNPLLKLKAKLMKNRIRNGIILMNGILGELQAEVQAIAPSESEKIEQFDDILEPVKNIFELVDIINKIPLPNLALFKIRAAMLRRRVLVVAELLVELQAEINNMANNTNTDTRVVRKMQATMNAIKDMMEVFSSIADTSLSILAKGKAITPAAKLMIKQFDMFDKLIDRISKLKDTRKANNQLRRLEEIVRSIAILATSMILLVPILALFILVSPAIILGVLVFSLMTKLVVKLVKSTVSPKTILLIELVTLVIGAFVIMAAMMLVLVIVVDKLKDGIGLIIGFVVGIIAFMIVLALLGAGLNYVLPFVAMAVAGIVLVTIAVGAILVMAICLKLLEFIDLDTETIKSNVQTVISTALECLFLAFGPQSDPRGPNQDTSFLDVIGGVLVNIIRALAASIILVLTCISVVAILVIAAMLRLLAEIDPKKLEEGAANAKLAIQTATDIMTTLFDSDDPDGKDGESNSIFGSLLTYVFEPLGKILKAIFAYYYLALMVVAMGLVLLLCTMIRLIANFDPSKIANGKENAKLAVQAATEIVADLFKGDDTDRTPSDRGGLLCVVGYVFGKEFENIIRAVLAIAYVGVLILALVMISFLAKQLAKLGEIDGGMLQKAKENAVLVVKTCGEIMNTIFSGDADADTNEGSGWFKKMLKWVLPDSLVDMIDAIVKIGKLALLVIAVGAIGKLADQLTALAEFKVSSAQAKQKAKSVIDAATTLVINLKSLSKGADVDEDDMSRIYDLCIGLSKIPSGLQPVANNLTKLDSYKIEAIESAGRTGIQIISTLKQMVEGINDINCDVDGVNARLDIMDRISKTVGAFVKVEAEDVKNSKDLTDNYIKFFKQVDSMDIKKLQHTDWLMRSWASISRDLKGDFEGLAKTINQHIMPMLEKVNETLDKTTKAQQDIINTLSQPVDINGAGSTGGSTLDFSTTSPDTTAPGGGGFEPTGSAQPGNTAAPKGPSGAPQINGGSRSQNDKLEPGKKYRIVVAEAKEGW